MPMDLSEMALEEVLRSYSSIKGHHTRCEKEIANLLQLLNTQYSSTSEEWINDRLEKLEKYTHKLSDITEYLVKIREGSRSSRGGQRILWCSWLFFITGMLLPRQWLTLCYLLLCVLLLNLLPRSWSLRSFSTTLPLPPFGHGRSNLRLFSRAPKLFPFSVLNNKHISTIAWTTSFVPVLTEKLPVPHLFTPHLWTLYVHFYLRQYFPGVLCHPCV